MQNLKIRLLQNNTPKDLMGSVGLERIEQNAKNGPGLYRYRRSFFFQDTFVEKDTRTKKSYR
jgi:hypothetical protein